MTRAASLDVDAFADGIAALQRAIRNDVRVPTTVADGLCGRLGGVLGSVRYACGPGGRDRGGHDRGEPVSEHEEQARLNGGADRLLTALGIATG